ncbi:hypothetical protein PTKIN_Ptkin13bG0180200 [Pterospermum kingtungense]
MCNVERVRRGFTVNGACSFCLDVLEDVDHLFRWCPDVEAVWKIFLPIIEFHLQQSLTFKEWLSHNICGKVLSPYFKVWNTAFAIIVWNIWQWRNQFVLAGKKFSTSFKAAWINKQVAEVERGFEGAPLVGAEY